MLAMTRRGVLGQRHVARMSQRVGAKRRPMTGSAICGNDVDVKDPDIAPLIRATLATPAHKFSAHTAHDHAPNPFIVSVARKTQARAVFKEL
jgi:hypothetical protein